MIKLTTERPEHAGTIELLLDASFGVDRHTKISYSYRIGVERVTSLCLVALENDRLVGTIRYWPILIGDTPSLLLGPVAVDSECRGSGLGGQLIQTSLRRAITLGYRSAILVGDESYYGRFGFHPASRRGITMPKENPNRVLALSLAPKGYAMPSGLMGPWRSVRQLAAAA